MPAAISVSIALSDSTFFPSGRRKIYHERSAIGDMLSAIYSLVIYKGLVQNELGLYLCDKKYGFKQKNRTPSQRRSYKNIIVFMILCSPYG